ncbi:MAG: NAD-dependent epimerase/dehydratase family protein, partial [Rubrivivax sp.]
SAVVHLGGVAGEGPFEPILEANVRGVYHLYEAARLAGTRRVVLASSNHVTGCYRQGERLDPCIHKPRPDGFYGVSKLFGEHMAQLYWDRCGIETVNLRLGTVTEVPQDRRALSTWLSYADFVRLVLACLRAPYVGCLTVYGVSGNAWRWWSESGWQTLGYEPQDSADPWQPIV